MLQAGFGKAQIALPSTSYDTPAHPNMAVRVHFVAVVVLMVASGSLAAVRLNKPGYNGSPLDWCREYGRNCGKPAAEAFCKSMGYKKVASFTGPVRVTKGECCRRIEFLHRHSSTLSPKRPCFHHQGPRHRCLGILKSGHVMCVPLGMLYDLEHPCGIQYAM